MNIHRHFKAKIHMVTYKSLSYSCWKVISHENLKGATRKKVKITTYQNFQLPNIKIIFRVWIEIKHIMVYTWCTVKMFLTRPLWWWLTIRNLTFKNEMCVSLHIKYTCTVELKTYKFKIMAAKILDHLHKTFYDHPIFACAASDYAN